MSKAEHLAAYAEGWTTGNVEKLLDSMAEDYVLDDPNHGRVTKNEMTTYVEGMKALVTELRGATEQSELIELSEVLTGEQGDELVAWAWWTVPGTNIAGSGLIKVADRGVISERLTYYTKLPE